MSECDILGNLTERDWKFLRKLVINLILDTDLQKHFIILNKFKNLLCLGNFEIAEETNRHFVLTVALKCADVGHGAKELSLHKLWSRRIIEEFYS